MQLRIANAPTSWGVEDPGDPAWRLLTDRLQDAYAVAGTGPPETVTAVRPYRRIDGVATMVRPAGHPRSIPCAAAHSSSSA